MISLYVILQAAEESGILGLIGGGAGGAGGGVITYLITKHLMDKNTPKAADVEARLLTEMDKRESIYKEQMLHDKQGSKAGLKLLNSAFEKMGENKMDKEQHDKEMQWMREELNKQEQEHDSDVKELRTDIKSLSTKVDTGFNELKTLLINR